MKPERIEEILASTGPVWFGGQRERVKQALLTVVNESRQTRRQSLVEAIIGTIVGFLVALVVQVFLMWFYNLGTTLVQDVSMTLFFTVASIIRSYCLRRYFNWRHHGESKC